MSEWSRTGLYLVVLIQYRAVLLYNIYNREQNWLIHDGTGSLWCGTGWYLVVLGQYNLVLLGIVKLLG